jgi:hypothetical protein
MLANLSFKMFREGCKQTELHFKLLITLKLWSPLIGGMDACGAQKLTSMICEGLRLSP